MSLPSASGSKRAASAAPAPPLDPPALVCQVGTTTLLYSLRCIDDLHAISAGIKKHVGKRRLILEFLTHTGTVFPLQLGEDFLIGDEMALRAELSPWLAKS
jgi:hypothetical protein